MTDGRSNSKQRQQRLRASCDGCFTAKVKCSKARPICSRCLACGLECRYSPSIRAGKPKADSHGSSRKSGAFPPNTTGVTDEGHAMYYRYMANTELYRLGNGWDTPPSLGPSMNRDSPVSHEATMCGLDDGMHDVELGVYRMDMPRWTVESEIQTFPLPDQVVRASGNRALSFPNGEMPTSLASPWGTIASGSYHGTQLFDTTSSPASIGPSYFPSPAATPNLPHHHHGPITAAADHACGCFDSCLQALRSLHNVSESSISSPDAIVLLNRIAVESCAGLLCCPACSKRSGISTTMMLMATILSKTAGMYRTAAQMHLGNASITRSDSSAPTSFQRRNSATGHQQAERSQPAVSSRDMERLREVCSLFHDVCAYLPDDAEVNRALVGHVGRTLGATMEAIKKMQGTWV